MNVSDVFDWSFFWQMFRNFVATGSPFLMIIVAISAAGMLMMIIIGAVRGRKA